MMFAKDANDHANHIQYIKVEAPQAVSTDEHHEADHPDHEARQAGAFEIIKKR